MWVAIHGSNSIQNSIQNVEKNIYTKIILHELRASGAQTEYEEIRVPNILYLAKLSPHATYQTHYSALYH